MHFLEGMGKKTQIKNELEKDGSKILDGLESKDLVPNNLEIKFIEGIPIHEGSRRFSAFNRLGC